MTPAVDTRLALVQRWLLAIMSGRDHALAPAAGDASFRRYFRVTAGADSYIVMDAPPEKEDCRPFVHAAEAFGGKGLNVPRILAADMEQGLLLLTDLGTITYLQALDEENCARLYGDALAALLRLQCGAVPERFPPYDAALLMREMALFRDWLLERHLGIAPSPPLRAVLDRTFELLTAAALEQPRVWVHRDYHSRNLMVTGAENPGVLDFQDAVMGPVTYDLVSLLRDCYIRWPAGRVDAWMAGHYATLRDAGALGPDVPLDQFREWFDLMGVQRHLKAAGIFARLYHRDRKAGYLNDIPRTVGYIREACGRTPALRELGDLVDELPL